MPRSRQNGNFLYCPRKQRGAALMVMLVIMVMGAATFLVSSLNRSAVQTERDRLTADALAQAKTALIAYAATYADTHSGKVHGYLPCPDEGQNITQDGQANSPCGATDVSRIGKLPWNTLGLQPLKDGSGECLWYAVSGTHKNSPTTLMMNDDTVGLFEVMAPDGVNYLAGSSANNRAVAVIFAPGNAQGGTQSHSSATGTPSCGGNYTASNYLDNDTTHNINNSVTSATANAVSRFIAGPVKDTSGTTIVNDRMIFITKDDIFNAIRRRADFVDPLRNPLLLMTQKAAECIADYGRHNNAGLSDKRLPWSARAPATTPVDTDCNYRDGTSTTRIMYGRLPNRVSGSRLSTNNQISQTSCGGTSSYYQLDVANCPAGWNTYYPWWSNWKDHVFYTLANSYRPAAGSSPSCGTCLTVNGGGQYAAVVIFAGQKLATQTRSTSSDRLNFSNYLEGNNLISNIPITTSGNGNYQSGSATSNFNDVLYCIKPDLSVAPC